MRTMQIHAPQTHTRLRPQKASALHPQTRTPNLRQRTAQQRERTAQQRRRRRHSPPVKPTMTALRDLSLPSPLHLPSGRSPLAGWTTALRERTARRRTLQQQQRRRCSSHVPNEPIPPHMPTISLRMAQTTTLRNLRLPSPLLHLPADRSPLTSLSTALQPCPQPFPSKKATLRLCRPPCSFLLRLSTNQGSVVVASHTREGV